MWQQTQGLAVVLLVVTTGSQTPPRVHEAPAITPITVNGKAGFLDAAGNQFVGAEFDICKTGPDGAVVLRVDGKDCYLDREGRVVVSSPDERPVAAHLAPFSRKVQGGSGRLEWGFADESGKIVIEPQFDEFQGFSEGVGRVVKNGLWGFVDSGGAILVEPRFKSAYWFSEGVSCVLLDDGKWAYADRHGRIVSSSQYEYKSVSFSEGLVPGRLRGKWGYVDRTWKIVIEPRFDNASPFSDGLAWVTVGRKSGVINRIGRMVIEPAEWDVVFPFSEGFAAVKPVGLNLVGYIDRQGRVAIPPRFTSAGQFRGGLARATESPEIYGISGGCWKGYDLINRFGEYVWKARH